jgi:pimeloyl-ACP methyl ester carboxylesterase
VAAFALIHGAGDAGWYWHLVAAELRARGHEAVSPDLPCDDESAGLPEYADTVAEAVGDWAQTRYDQEPRDRYDDAVALFYQDVPPELAAEALHRARGQSEARMGEPSPLRAWPDVPTRVLICRDDRLFPAGFLRRVARERLGITPDEIDGGHTPALSRPRELAGRLEAYAAREGLPGGR